MGGEALMCGMAEGGFEDWICWNTLPFDKSLYLEGEPKDFGQLLREAMRTGHGEGLYPTISIVCFALSLTRVPTMGGIFLDAGMCPSRLLMRQDKDMAAAVEENAQRPWVCPSRRRTG